MKYIFVENGNINGAGECKCLSESVINVQVSDEIYEDFNKTPYKYICSGEQIIESPDFELLKQKAEAEVRKEELMV